MKYIVTVARGSMKRAVTLEVPTDGDAKAYAEELMTHNRWQRAEVYVNDRITPYMDDAYSHIFTCNKQSGGMIWEDSVTL